MKSRLPSLRKELNSDPTYFKKVYMHTFELVKPAGSRTLALDTACAMWGLFIPPALSARPSALSRIPPGENALSTSTARPPEFGESDFEAWIVFQKAKSKAVTKDTWSLFVDFIRSIDKEYKEYDDSGELRGSWTAHAHLLSCVAEHNRRFRRSHPGKAGLSALHLSS